MSTDCVAKYPCLHAVELLFDETRSLPPNETPEKCQGVTVELQRQPDAAGLTVSCQTGKYRYKVTRKYKQKIKQ